MISSDINKCKVQSKGGFTIIELLIAMAIASAVAMSGFALFSATNRSYQIQEGVVLAQQSARAALGQLTRDIRMAGFGLSIKQFPITIGEDVGTAITLNAPIMVNDSASGPDSIILTGIGARAGVLQNLSGTSYNDKNQNLLRLSDVSAFKTNSGAFAPERKFISLEGTYMIKLKATQSLLDQNVLECVSNLPFAPIDGMAVYIIQAIEYSIATDLTGCSTEKPCLASKDYTYIRGGGPGGSRQLYAENIEDMQFAFGFGPGVDKNSSGSYDEGDFVDGLTAAEQQSVKAVRVTVVAMAGKDPSGRQYKRPAAENHPEGDTNLYRRRAFSQVVKLRNPS